MSGKERGRLRAVQAARPAAPTRPLCTEAKLRGGFLLTPRFTLVAFAGFVDALRLAADEGDRNSQQLCTWANLGSDDMPVTSSCGASVKPDTPMASPQVYDYLIPVGGLPAIAAGARRIRSGEPPRSPTCSMSQMTYQATHST